MLAKEGDGADFPALLLSHRTVHAPVFGLIQFRCLLRPSGSVFSGKGDVGNRPGPAPPSCARGARVGPGGPGPGALRPAPVSVAILRGLEAPQPGAGWEIVRAGSRKGDGPTRVRGWVLTNLLRACPPATPHPLPSLRRAWLSRHPVRSQPRPTLLNAHAAK